VISHETGDGRPCKRKGEQNKPQKKKTLNIFSQPEGYQR